MLKAKNIIVFMMILSFGNLFSQSEIEFEINEKIFTNFSEEMFYSSDKKATLIGMSLHINLTEMIEQSLHEKKLGPNVETGFIQGTSLFYIKEIEVRGNEKYIILSLIKAGNQDKTINFMSGFPLKEEDKYLPEVINAANSAKLKE